MDYPIDAFEALIAEVEHQGGALLPEPHVSEDVIYTNPPYHRPNTQRKATCGCNNPSRLVSVYDPGEDKQGGSGFVTACAVCDSMGNWPRYSEAVYEVDPTLNPCHKEEDEEDAE